MRYFERWSMNAELKKYDNVLEPRDARSYQRWETPTEKNELFLNCDEWLQENPIYLHLEDNIDILILKAMQNVKKQFENFECHMRDFWINKQLGNFAIIKNERLKNPTEILPVLLQRFVD
jgi:hypothetical protein